MEIQRVVCVGGKYLNFDLNQNKYRPPFVEETIKYHIVDVDDTEKLADVQALRNCFESTVQFIDAGLRAGKPTFVHCMGGTSRSASIICAYLIWKYPGDNMTTDQALRLVRSARPIATPNNGFMRQLENWYTTINRTEVE